MLFVVVVVVAAVVLVLLVSIYVLFFACVFLCLLPRFGVFGHRRGTALGHPCEMPPTRANIAVLLLKTWLAPDSTYT